jgi:hypothetical protein
MTTEARLGSQFSVFSRGKGIISLTGLFLYLLSTQLCLGQDINFNASVDKTEVGLAEQVTLTVSVSGSVKSVPKPELPPLDDFTVYSSGRSHNFSFTNGRLSSSVIFTYVLLPGKTGKLTIGPARIELKGKTFQTAPIEITVAGGGETQPDTPPTGNEKQKQKPRPGGKDLFIETVVNKRQGYVNEQITLTFRCYRAVRLLDNPQYAPPSLTGFWSEDLPPKRQYNKVVNGKQYFVQELKTALFPTSTGKLTIGPAELKCMVEDIDRLLKRDPFAVFGRDLFSLFRQGKPLVLKSKPIGIVVAPLPQIGKPENFTGTVGSYKLKVSVDKTEVEVGHLRIFAATAPAVQRTSPRRTTRCRG